MRLELLGTFRVSQHGQELEVGPPKQQAVLGFLAGRLGEVVSIEEIVDAVWGDELPRTAVNAVHTYVAGLRRALQLSRDEGISPCALVSEGGGYALHMKPESVDARTFEHRHDEARRLGAHGEREAAVDLLESALDLWRGDAYRGVPGPFAVSEGARLQEVRLGAVEYWASEMLALGRHSETVAALSSMILKAPTWERLRALLMLALQGSGRRAQALEVYRETRALLKEELGIEPGADLQALHQQILTDDPRLLGPRSPALFGAPSRPEEITLHEATTRPAQLPPTARGFIGRGRELARLHRMMAESGTRGEGTAVAMVEGAPGVGKSALALRAAHELADRFPDGQLFVDMCGSSLRCPRVSAVEAQSLVLRSLGIPELMLPSVPEERSALYRSMLGSRRVLLFLDDVPPDARLEPLLNGPACVLATSRWRQTDPGAGFGAHRMVVEPLRPQDSVELLSRLVGPERLAAEREAALWLARLCGNLPLPLRIAAEAFTKDPDQSIASLAGAVESEGLDQLAVVEDAAASMRNVFKKSYRSLPADAAWMFRLLGLCTTREVTVSSAATLANIGRERAARLLDVLAASYLLEEVTSGRYRISSLLHRYAVECAEEEPLRSRTAALSRTFGDGTFLPPAIEPRKENGGDPWSTFLRSTRGAAR